MSRKNEQILYTGIECVVDGKVVHCTLAYLNLDPDSYGARNYFPFFPYGESIKLHLVRKGSNSTHSGYQVELPAHLISFFKEHIPHITMSVADGCKPVDTWKVFATQSDSVECDITVIGTVGYWTSKRGFQTKPFI